MSEKKIRVWALWLLNALMVLGIGISLLMTRHHEQQLYGGEEAGQLWGCAAEGKVNCDIVNTSEWSEVFGVPLFTWAVPTYLLVLGLSLLAIRGQRRWLPLLMGLGVGASLFSGFLYYISVVELGYVCLWCIRLYGVNAAILVLSAVAGARRDALPTGADLAKVLGSFALLSLGAVVVQQVYRAQLLEGTPEIPVFEPVVEVRLARADPSGEAPVLSWEVKTEDGNTATLTTAPSDPWKGNPEAKVVIVEFADFECGYCKRVSGQLNQVVQAYGDDVLMVFKHFPMDPRCNPGVNNKKHREACNAAVAAACAQEQGKFWAFHDLAFKNQHQLKFEHLETYIEKIGMDPDDFKRCVRRSDIHARVKANGEEGKALDIHGTPRIFINGKLYKGGMSAQQYARLVQEQLGLSATEGHARLAQLKSDQLPRAPLPSDLPPMQRVEMEGLRFEMDTFEASIDDGKATVGAHKIPATRMSWFAARDACEAAGKRLCTEREWTAACQGQAPIDDDGDGQFADDMVEGNAYPYGEYHERGRCWDARNKETERPVYTGEMPGCANAQGVYDLTGNVEEWVGETAATAVLLGGSFDTAKDFARCYRRNDTFGPGLANRRTGFRCCRAID
jgi:protein-disulfide isomerase/uncharacterized membrane protein